MLIFAGVVAVALVAAGLVVAQAVTDNTNHRMHYRQEAEEHALRARETDAARATEWNPDEYWTRVESLLSTSRGHAERISSEQEALGHARMYNTEQLRNWRAVGVLVEHEEDIVGRRSAVAVIAPTGADTEVPREQAVELARTLGRLSAIDLKLLQAGLDPATVHGTFELDGHGDRLRAENPGSTEAELSRKVDAALSAKYGLPELVPGAPLKFDRAPGVTDEQARAFTFTLAEGAAAEGAAIDPGARVVVCNPDPRHDSPESVRYLCAAIGRLQEIEAADRRYPVTRRVPDLFELFQTFRAYLLGDDKALGDGETVHRQSEHREVVEALDAAAHGGLKDLRSMSPEAGRQYKKLVGESAPARRSWRRAGPRHGGPKAGRTS